MESRPTIIGASVITALVPSPRREGRFDVVVDGGVAATVGAESVARLRLAVGLGLDEGGLAAIVREGQVIAAVDRALDALAFRDRSAMELKRALWRKGVERPVAELAVARLVEGGLVDDARFSRSLARSRVAGTGASRRRVEQDLARRGVAPAVAEAAIAEVWAEEEVDEGALALTMARKRARALAGLEPRVRQRRLYGYLARRGYDPEEIRRALDTLERETPDVGWG